MNRKLYQLIMLLAVTQVAACSVVNDHKDRRVEFESCSYAASIKPGDPRRFDEAFLECQKSASEGNPYSQKNLGYLYLQGNSYVQANKDEGLKWFRAAAAQGNEAAIYRLSQMEPGQTYAKNAEPILGAAFSIRY